MLRQVALLLFLLIPCVLATGCSSPDLTYIVGQNAVAIDEVGNAKTFYDFRMGLREYQGKLVYLHGSLHDYNGIAVVVKAVDNVGRHTRTDLVLWNMSKEPQTVYPDEFSLVAPDGRRFTYSVDEHIRRRTEYGARAAMLVSETVQPGMSREVTLYFETGSVNAARDNWLVQYRPHMFVLFANPEPIHVLARPVYSIEY